jgi:hypothetical protein
VATSEPVLRRADELVAAGRALDAIDELTAHLRIQRDPEVERRLVAVRHQAFGQLPTEGGHPRWPRALSDPFPGETGIPVTTPEHLGADLLGGALLHHGCLRVDGLVGADQVARLVALIDDAFDERERTDAGGATYVPFDVGRERASGFGHDAFVRVVDVPAALFELVELFTTCGVRRAVTGHLGERPAMIANKWVLRRSPSGKIGADFHQDGAFLGTGIRTVDCWIALSDCGPGTGRPAIEMVPRRFPLLEAGEAAAFWWSLHPDTVRSAMPDAEVASPTFRAGDALFFDELLPHRTSVGTDLGERYAIESWFVAPTSYPDRHVPVVL